MKRVDKVRNLIVEQMDKLEAWEKAVEEKKILWRNTPEEIREVRNDIFMEMVAPLLVEYKMLTGNEPIAWKA